jgi:hypothetical protein
MRRNLAQSLHDAWLFDILFVFQDLRCLLRIMSQHLLRTSQCIFLGGHGDSRDSPTLFIALLASNLLAQFSRQIVIKILGLVSPKVCGNLAVRPLVQTLKNVNN